MLLFPGMVALAGERSECLNEPGPRAGFAGPYESAGSVSAADYTVDDGIECRQLVAQRDAAKTVVGEHIGEPVLFAVQREIVQHYGLNQQVDIVGRRRRRRFHRSVRPE